MVVLQNRKIVSSFGSRVGKKLLRADIGVADILCKTAVELNAEQPGPAIIAVGNSQVLRNISATFIYTSVVQHNAVKAYVGFIDDAVGQIAGPGHHAIVKPNLCTKFGLL